MHLVKVDGIVVVFLSVLHSLDVPSELRIITFFPKTPSGLWGMVAGRVQTQNHQDKSLGSQI